jgi:hypothetical protein
MAQKEADDESC